MQSTATQDWTQTNSRVSNRSLLQLAPRDKHMNPWNFYVAVTSNEKPGAKVNLSNCNVTSHRPSSQNQWRNWRGGRGGVRSPWPVISKFLGPLSPQRSSICQYLPKISAINVNKQSRARLLLAHPVLYIKKKQKTCGTFWKPPFQNQPKSVRL